MKKKYISVLTAIILFVFAANLFGCSAQLRVVRKEEDYSDFLSRLKSYYRPSVPNDEETEFTGPEINGFMPLYYTDFDYAMAFSGGYAFAIKDERYVYVGKNGDVFDLPNDLSDCEILFGKYVYEENGLLGVKTVFGERITDALYEDIEIAGATVAAKRPNGESDIFKDGKLIAACLTDMRLLSENYIISDSGLFTADLTPVFCGDYRMASVADNGIGIISYNGRVGYGKVTGEVVVPPEYDFIAPYRFGYGAAKRNGGKTTVFDEMGNAVSELDADKVFVSFDGKYLLYGEYMKIRIADAAGNDLTSRSFDEITNFKVYGGFLITHESTRVYSLREQNFVFGVFESVVPSEGMIIAITLDGAAEIYDEEFKLIAGGLEFAAFSDNVLTVKSGGKYYFYVAE